MSVAGEVLPATAINGGGSGDSEASKEVYKKQPKYLVISDPHGSKNFPLLIGRALGMDDAEFTTNNIREAMNTAGVDRIYVLGDLLDRADDPVGVFEKMEILLALGPEQVHFVTGNHDLYAHMNVAGLHLPNYKGYQGIAKDYQMTVAGKPFAPKYWLDHKLKQTTDGEGIKDQNHWLPVFADYTEYANKRQKERWEAKYNEIRDAFAEAYHTPMTDETGKDLEKKCILNYPEKYAGDDCLKEDAELRQWWSEMLGRNVGEFVSTGLRAVDKMSINWWQEKRKEMNQWREKYPGYESLWQRMEVLLDEEIVPEYQKKLDQEYNDGNFEWLMVDAIMNRNYESAEWNAYDWLFHKKWGSLDGGLLAKLNEYYNENQIIDEATSEIRQVDYTNYLQDPFIQRMFRLYSDNFSLYEIDDYGNLYTHGPLPLDADGDISIGYVDERGKMICEDEKGKRIKGIRYKGQEYQGMGVLECFDRMAEDMRAFNPEVDSPTKIKEALTLYNSIFADNTLLIKQTVIAENMTQVAEKYNFTETDQPPAVSGTILALNSLGMRIFFSGHNPVGKLVGGIPLVVSDAADVPMSIPVDYGMSNAFEKDRDEAGDAGAAFIVSGDDGIKRYVLDRDPETIVTPEDYRRRYGELVILAMRNISDQKAA